MSDLNSFPYADLTDAFAAIFSPYIPIASIPPEWMDGQDVDLWALSPFINSSLLRRVPDCRYCKSAGCWQYDSEEFGSIDVGGVTHAMLPPQSPSKD